MKFEKIPAYHSSRPYFLILGGYGHGNFGDEAILSATLRDLCLKFPDFDLIVLTPNPTSTKQEHNCLVSEAPRVAFFDIDTDNYYWLENLRAKIKFIFKMVIVYLSAFFDKHKIPFCLVGNKRIKLLSLVKGASLVYFSGGGYLTGKTLSRLWDGCLFIGISKIYEKPVVLSGQTIGLFRNTFDRWLAKKAFTLADLIALRDAYQSLNDIKRVNVRNEKMSITFDDALFCDKIQDRKLVDKLLRDSGMSDDLVEQGFVMLQFHYWGAPNAMAQQKLLDSISELASFIVRETKYSVLLFAMHPSDLKPLGDLLAVKNSHRLFSLGYCGNFKSLKAVIARCNMCISMKHHPLIFSLSEKKPVISLAYDPYYEHKNGGLLALFGLEQLNFNITNEFDIEAIKNAILKALNEKGTLEMAIEEKLCEFRAKREKFLDEVAEVLAQNTV